MQGQSTHRLFQLSYLRALVTLLVVAHHSALAYVTFKLPGHGFTTAIPVTDASKWSGFDVFVGWNDVFFMALMFFVSGLFVWPSLRRHGVSAYLRRRFLRLGVPFVIAAALLAPLTYYPAYLQFAGNADLGKYARAWSALGVWPAGPAWFLWVLLVFDCVAAFFFTALPHTFEKLAHGVRTLSNRPARLFLILAALSCAAYVPMALHFGGESWWGWGPFSAQSSRPFHYFVYFAMGMCLGAFGAEIPIFERAGRLARRWWLWAFGTVLAFLSLAAMAVHGQVSAYAFLFPISCAASSLFLISVVVRFVRPWRWADNLSENAYGIYILHYLFVIWIQYAALHVMMPAVVKCGAVIVVATGLSWMTAGLLRQSKIIARVI